MDILMVIAAIILAIMGLLFRRGSRIIKLREANLGKIAKQDGREPDIMGRCSYHGGFPQIPKPQKLTAAMTDNDLVLLTSKGQVEALPFSRWREIEKFSTLTKQDPKKRSVILWSPIDNLIFADRLRHFIVIKYQDQSDEDNRLLIEYARPDELSEIFEKLKAGWKRYLIRFEKKGN